MVGWFGRGRALCIGAILALGVLGAAPAAPTGAPVEITAILPVSGPLALIGASQQQGLHVLENLVNSTGGIQNRPLRFHILDDQSDPQTSVQLFNGVIAGGAQVVLGGVFSGACKAVLPIAQQNGPVLYCLTPAVRPPKGSYVFSGNIHPVDLSAETFRYFLHRGWTNIALLLSTDASGQEVAGGIPGLLAAYPKIHVVAYERFNPADSSVTGEIVKIESAHPQALLIWSASGIPVALHALSDTGSKMPVATSNSLMLYSAMDQFHAILPEQLYFAAPKWAEYPAVGSGPVRDALTTYFTAFKAVNVRPDIGQNTAWDPALIVVQALRALGPDAKAPQIRDYILNLHGFAGTNGFYDFRTGDQRGLNPNDTIMTRWSPSADTWVKAN